MLIAATRVLQLAGTGVCLVAACGFDPVSYEPEGTDAGDATGGSGGNGGGGGTGAVAGTPGGGTGTDGGNSCPTDQCSCVEGSCNLQCSATCAGECSGSPGSECTVRCSDGDCYFACDTGKTCNIACATPGTCTVFCFATATCIIDCIDAAECLIKGNSTSCSVSCSGQGKLSGNEPNCAVTNCP